MKTLFPFAGITLLSLLVIPGSSQTSPAASQSPTAAQTTGQAPSQTVAPAHRSKRRKRVATTVAANQPATSANNVAATPDETPQDRVADQKLLTKQQGQSAHAAAINTQVVQSAQQRLQQQQNEVRIQDAPGPGQTGVVPGAGVPVAPVNANDRIQDAPGPAQTLPTLPATVPPAAADQPVTSQPAAGQPATSQPASTSVPAGTSEPTQAVPSSTNPPQE